MEGFTDFLPWPRRSPDAEQWNREILFAGRVQALLSEGRTATVAGATAYACSVPHYVVGGDYCDLLPLAGGGLRLVVADVMGKGFGPAMVTVAARAACRACTAAGLAPGDLLCNVNNLLFDDLQFLGSFLTMQVIDYDPACRTLRLASAGHPYPLLLRKQEEQSEPIKARGVSIGMLAGRRYAELTAPVMPGDRLLVCSDGALEVKDKSGQELSARGLERLFRQHRAKHGHALFQAVLADLAAFAEGTGVRDDVTLAVLDFHAEVQAAEATEEEGE
ncbi:MAG TPA: PP2C family protein-serine/threonine phosphatase [Symbiobacteriaceae bacterium]|nr:PP2C family protein-serine/threonine phosphatase [Symbiobacteriaceae bacterium]